MAEFSDISDEESLFKCSQDIADCMLTFNPNDSFSDIYTTPVQVKDEASTSKAADSNVGASKNMNRFSRISDEELNFKISSRIPPNTSRQTRWAVGLFQQWKTYRNNLAAECNELSAVTPSLEEMTYEELNYCLTKFIWEVRKKNGSEYPPKTLYIIICAIQRYLQQHKEAFQEGTFFTHVLFKPLRESLDAVMKEGTANGNGLQTKQVNIITTAHETILLNKGILGKENPKQLLRTLVFKMGLSFALRSGKEHRDLMPSQLIVQVNDEGRKYLQYTETCTKTNSGGLKHKSTVPKKVYGFQSADPLNIVDLHELYMSKCPDIERNAYYLQPRKNYEEGVWFTNVLVGHNKLRNVVGDMFKEAEIEGYFTNHSLRASAATRLFNEGVDEQLICEQTGHRSSAVRAYKRTSLDQKEKVSDIVNGIVEIKEAADKTDENGNSNSGSSLFNQGVDEELICQQTHHRSIAITACKRSSVDQNVTVSDIVNGNVQIKIPKVEAADKTDENGNSMEQLEAPAKIINIYF